MHRLTLAALLFPLAACTVDSGPGSGPYPGADVEHLITAASIAGHVRFLSDDLLEGRGVATRGDELARRYIATQFETFGLQPGGPDDNWEQQVPMMGLTAEVTKPLTVRAGSETISFSAPTDYTAESGHLEPTSAWSGAEIVFVGFGIHAPEQDWDDFKDVDVAGKVLMVMNNDPAGDPSLFAGDMRLYYGRWSYKFEEAARRGAVGCIVIHTPPSAGYPFQVIQNTHGHESFWLPFKEDEPTMAVRSWCSEEAARQIATLGGHDLDALRRTAETREFRPVSLGVTADLELTNTIRELTSANVIGKIEGSDLADEAVIVTAHFDHLGVGTEKSGDSIYNGALDNGSGTAALIALAQACAALPTKPRRTILFAAVTAEESGLLGSLYYARNPTFQTEKIIANYNMDSINIWGATRDIAMIGHGKNSLTELATAVAERRGRELVPNPDVSLGLFYRSDHFSFARQGIPSAYFKSGKDFYEDAEAKSAVMNAYTAVRYHQPSDEYSADWDLRGAVADTQLLLECLLTTAGQDEPAKWAPGDEFEKRR